MSTASDRPWEQVADDQLVEELILAMQRATAVVLAGNDEPTRPIALPAPEVATALLNLLASVLEPAPECRTPMGMRKVSEAARKHLLLLMRGVRELSRPADGDLTH